MTRNSKTRFALLIASAALIGIALGASWMGVSRVYARQLSTTSDVTRRVKDLIVADQVLHFYVTIHQRIDRTVREAPDPYHLPIVPWYSDKRVIERWIGLDTQVEIRRLASQADLILSKHIATPDRILIYDGVTGVTQQIDRKRTTQDETQSVTPESSLDGVRLSKWGQLAWVVRFQPVTSAPDLFDTLPQKLLDQGPYAADLEFDKIQVTQEIDQDSGFLVSIATHALTPRGPVLIYSEEYSYPEVLSVADLPQGWNEPPQNATSTKGSQTLDSTLSLDMARANIPFAFFLPAQHTLDKYGLDRADVIYDSNHSLDLSSSLGFEPYSAPYMGLGVWTIFLSSKPTDPEHPKAISLIQAPADQVTPFLRQSPPIWHNSHALSITINQKNVVVWILTGGLLRTNTNLNPMIGAAFELNKTFVYAEIQNLSENDLITILESLQPARPN